MNRFRLKPSGLVLTSALCAVLCLVLITPLWASQLEENEEIDMSLKDAQLVEVLRSFAAIMGGDSLIDPAVAGSLTIELDDTSWRDALDRICLQQEINCEVLSGDKPILRVRPLNAAEGSPLQAGCPEAIDLSLKKAPLKQTLESFGIISGRSFNLAEGVQGTVTLNLHGAPWPVVLEEVCDLEGCVVEWGEDEIHVRARDIPSPRRTDLALNEVALEDALEIIAGMPLFGPLGTPAVSLPEGLNSSVSVDLKNAHWVEILNTVLGPLNLEWKFRYGAPSRLEVSPASSETKTIKEATLRPRPSSGSEGFELGLRFFPTDSAPKKGAALFNWQKPLHGITAADGWRFQTSWIPFSPDLQVLVPMLTRCAGVEKGHPKVHLFDPIQLPLETVWSSRFEGMIVELEPATKSGHQAKSKALASVEGGCSTHTKAGSDVMVTRVGNTTSPKASSRLALPGEIGAYLLLTLPGESQVAAAVVALGKAGEELRLALVKPNGVGGVQMMERHLAPGESIAEIGPAEGNRFELRLEL